MNAFIRSKHEAVRDVFEAIAQNIEGVIEDRDNERAKHPEHTDATEVLIAHGQVFGDVISEFLLVHGWGIPTGICEEFQESYRYFWSCAAMHSVGKPCEDEAHKAIGHFRSAVSKFREKYPEDEYTRTLRAESFAMIGHDALDEKN